MSTRVSLATALALGSVCSSEQAAAQEIQETTPEARVAEPDTATPAQIPSEPVAPAVGPDQVALYLNPGLLLSSSWKGVRGPGVGVELSMPLVLQNGDDAPTIVGPLMHWQHQAHGERFMFGLEAAHVVGIELGAALRLPQGGERETGLHIGLFLSLIAVNVGPRFVMWPQGTEVGMAISLKLPVLLAGEEPVFGGLGHGRPFRGEQPVALTFHCTPSRTPLRSLDLERRAIAGCWLRDAVDEQLSVAAFLRLAQQLRAHGAPASLIARARAAAREEAGHAARCLYVLQGLTGLALRVDSSPVAPDAAPSSLALLAVESALDGAHGEGEAAHELQRTAHDALPAVRTQLSAIAREEHSHAVLARDIVAWAEQRGGAEVRRAVREAHAAQLATPVSSARGLARQWGLPRLLADA